MICLDCVSGKVHRKHVYTVGLAIPATQARLLMPQQTKGNECPDCAAKDAEIARLQAANEKLTRQIVGTGIAKNVLTVSNAPANKPANRQEYQRELMRKRRAEAKANREAARGQP